MPRSGLPRKAQVQLDKLLPTLSPQRKAAMELLLVELNGLELDRAILEVKGGNDPGSKHWNAYCEKDRLTTEMKTTIKHLLNIWTPGTYA